MSDSPTEKKQRNSPRPRWILIGFLAVAGFFLIAEHRAHLLGWLPYLLLLACPLMHLFHGHGGHGGHGTGKPPDSPGSPSGHAQGQGLHHGGISQSGEDK